MLGLALTPPHLLLLSLAATVALAACSGDDSEPVEEVLNPPPSASTGTTSNTAPLPVVVQPDGSDARRLGPGVVGHSVTWLADPPRIVAIDPASSNSTTILDTSAMIVAHPAKNHITLVEGRDLARTTIDLEGERIRFAEWQPHGDEPLIALVEGTRLHLLDGHDFPTSLLTWETRTSPNLFGIPTATASCSWVRTFAMSPARATYESNSPSLGGGSAASIGLRTATPSSSARTYLTLPSTDSISTIGYLSYSFHTRTSEDWPPPTARSPSPQRGS